MKKSTLTITALALALTLVLTACGNGAVQEEGPDSAQPQQPVSQDALSEDPGLIEVVDCAGRTVTVPYQPDQVAPIFATTAHIVAMLGDSEKITAVAAGNMRDLLLLELYPAIADARVPKGGGSDGVNVEELFSDPVPEVIFCDLALIQDDKMVERIEKFGVPLVVINYNSVEEQKYAVTLIGSIMGREAEAQAYCDYVDRVEELVTQRTGNLPQEEQRVVYHAINELLRAEGTNTLPGDWMPRMGIRMAGAAPVDEASDSKNRISLEMLMEYDPEYIIINGEDVYDYIALNERLHVLSAWQNERIYLLPHGISRWAHTFSVETPLAMLWVGKTIYPEYYEDIDMENEVKQFYSEIFHAQLSDETVQAILAGRGLRTVKNREEPL